MKAQRRHELKTNVLYAWLSEARVWAEAHKGAIFVGALIVLGVFTIATLWIRRRLDRPREAWTLLSQTSTQEDQYRRLEEEYGSTRAGSEGRLLWASLLYERRRHEEARQRLQRVLADAGDDAYLGARALVGLATIAEQERNVDEAVRLYQRVLDEYPAPGCVWLATERVRVLRSPHRPTAPPLAFVPLPVSRPSMGSATQPTAWPRQGYFSED